MLAQRVFEAREVLGGINLPLEGFAELEDGLESPVGLPGRNGGGPRGLEVIRILEVEGRIIDGPNLSEPLNALLE